MLEQDIRWQIGQEVSLPRVNSYQIIQLVGRAGNIHIDERGHYHVFWRRGDPDGRIVLIHHGGTDGFADLKAVKHQHERVILRYTGMAITVPFSQFDEIPPEEKQDGIPIQGQDFPTLAAQLNTVRLPGEQQVLQRWIGTLQDISQELPAVTNHGHLSQIRERLDKLLSETSLTRSINKYKQAAVSSLQTARIGQVSLTSGVSEAQLQLLRRAEQTVAITLGTMERYNAVERLQISWNGVVDKLPGMAAFLLKKLQSPHLLPDDNLDKVVGRVILHESQSLQGQLNLLYGEPYFGKAQEFIDNLAPVKKCWQERNYQTMFNILTQQAQELEVWKRRVKEEHEGVGFGRYNVTKA